MSMVILQILRNLRTQIALFVNHITLLCYEKIYISYALCHCGLCRVL